MSALLEEVEAQLQGVLDVSHAAIMGEDIGDPQQRVLFYMQLLTLQLDVINTCIAKLKTERETHAAEHSDQSLRVLN
ncbi:hypothetical protein [Dokdonella ginsengisoli]|uniref:Uncharacterized protein n=1 Tax=Dokdonella ginsengisoli TaxID=363846 RepID=A0ABV9QXX5_9GAMM